MALGALWRSWGVTGGVLLGHSLGEIACAALSGALSVEQAVHMAAAREVALMEGGAKGGMAAILADRATATALVAEVDASQKTKHGSNAWNIDFAGYNGPTHHVVAGTREAIADLIALQTAFPVKRVELPVKHPFHSPLVAPAAKQWAASYVITDPASASTARVISTLSGAEVSVASLRSMAHWERHACSPVMFEAALVAAIHHAQVLLTISPAASLASMVRRAVAPVSPAPVCVDAFDALSGPSFSVVQGLLQAAVRLFCVGVGIDWRAVYADLTRFTGSGIRLQLDPWLPPYAWARDPIALPGVAPSLLPSAAKAQKEERWTPSAEAFAQLREHVINGEAILPAAAQVMLLLGRSPALSHVDFIAPARVPEGDNQATLATLSAGEEIKLQWSVSGDALECAVARAAERVPHDGVAEANAFLAEAERKCTDSVPVDQFYTHLRVVQQLAYGRHYRGVAELRMSPDRRSVYAVVRSDDECKAGFPVSVALLDACLHTGAALLSPSDGPHIPAHMTDVTILNSSPEARCDSCAPSTATIHLRHLRKHLLCVHRLIDDGDAGPDGKTACVFVYDARTKTPLYGIGRYTVAPTSAQQRLLQRRVWVPTPLGAPISATATAWLMFPDGDVLSHYKAKLSSSSWVAEASATATDLKAHVRDLLASAPRPIARMKVMYAWPLCPLANEEVSTVLRLRCTPLLQVLQLLAEHTDFPVDFYLLTRGAVRSASSPTSLDHCVAAALQAMVGVASVELTSDRLRLHTIDLPHQPTDVSVVQNSIFALLDADLPTSAQFAIGCAGAYLTPKLEPLARAGLPTVARNTAGASHPRTGVVSGGLGGVGRHLAAWLLASAPLHLRVTRVVLLGRTMPDDGGVKLISDIASLCGAVVVASAGALYQLRMSSFGESFTSPTTSTSVEVVLRKCDVSNEADVNAAMCDVRPHVVVHSAGILRDRALAWMTEEDLHTSLDAKACAAWYFRKHAPVGSVIVLCSSVTAVLHTAGQCNYAAGNAFLDAMAEGHACVSVAWGPWRGVGMAATFDQTAARSPCRPMPPSRALAALTHYVAAHCTCGRALCNSGHGRAYCGCHSSRSRCAQYRSRRREGALHRIEQRPRSPGGSAAGHTEEVTAA